MAKKKSKNGLGVEKSHTENKPPLFSKSFIPPTCTNRIMESKGRASVLDVTPVSCVPPPHPVNNSGLYLAQLPAVVFLTCHPTIEEWLNIIAATKNGVALAGAAAMGKAGPAIGSVDIGESEDEFLFRVALPGIARDANVFTCDVQPEGAIVIKGKTLTGGKTVGKDSMVFQMQTQNLSPPGEFSIAFQLPGPIDHQKPIRAVFGTDGIFESIVRKKFPCKGAE